MKHLCNFFAAVVVLLSMAACDKTGRFENDLFSVKIPTGYIAEEIESDISVIPSAQLTAADDNSSIFILAFPFKGNPEKVLANQTLGGANPALSGMTYPSMPSSFTFGKVSGQQIAMRGSIEGINVEGTSYCFERDGCTFFVYSLSRTGKSLESLDKDVIESVRVNSDEMSSYDGRRRIDTVVKMASLNLPMPVDELTDWTDVTVDHDARQVVMDMTLAGSAEDYGNAQELLDGLRDAMAVNLKANRDTDWLILVPSDEDYALVYRYATHDDGLPVASINIPADELK